MRLSDVVNRAALRDLQIIINDDCPPSEKYAQLDALLLRVMNQHPDGLAAEVAQQIAREQTRVLYPGWKG